MAQVDDILRHMKEINASDAHLVSGAPVTYRIFGELGLFVFGIPQPVMEPLG